MELGDRPVSRRGLLKGVAGLGAAAAFARADLAADRLARGGVALRRHPPLRKPGSLPYPRLPEGTDTLPKIEHIIVVMMENHSFDNYFGMLRRGDGFRLDHRHRPRAHNPDGHGNLVRAFHMPSACQLDREPSQAWNASHRSYDRGRMDGFVEASGPVAMGYWTGDDIPFYYGLGRTFPIADRWFCSTLCQTYPNRLFLLAGTAAGLVSTSLPEITTRPEPPNGSILDRLNAHGIPWKDYATDLPQVALLVKSVSAWSRQGHIAKIDDYFTDAAAGKLPAVSFVDSAFLAPGSEENEQDIRIGEQFVSRVVNAAMHGPGWPGTLLVWLYDEHGGYYDHVPPPRAPAPDDIPPEIHVPPDEPGGYDRYGFRVPAAVVSPYARRRYVSHVVHDHTSILKLIETKWNLRALTYRDANADPLLDFLDLRARRPPFLDPPELPRPALADADAPKCTPGAPGPIPPSGAVSRARR